MVTPVAAPFLSAAFSLRSRSSSAFRSSSDTVTPCQLEMSHWAEEFIGGLSQVQTLLENFSLSAWYEARSTERSVLRTKYEALSAVLRAKHPVLSTSYRVPSTKHLGLCTEYNLLHVEY